MKLTMMIGLGSTCSGCDIAILDLAEGVLDLAKLADILFWPTAMDFKFHDVEALEDKAVDLALYHGTIRTSEHEHVARLMRDKAKFLLAFGSCACFGGIPGLCNLVTRKQVFDTAYRSTPSTVNPEGIVPQTGCSVNGCELTLPELRGDGKALGDVVDVDWFMPGCPPAVSLIAELIPVIEGILAGGAPPPSGTVFASDKTVCDECLLAKENKSITGIRRIHEVKVEPGRCLLEQGLICMGPATRGGCGASCLNAYMPCRGCMGPAPGVKDQGARMISAIASVIASADETEISEEDMNSRINDIADPVGTFYRFTLPNSLINRKS